MRVDEGASHLAPFQFRQDDPLLTDSNPGEAERHPANFGGNMKFRISLILLVIALAASSAVTAHARECTNSTIKGDYAFTIHGQISTPGGRSSLMALPKRRSTATAS
jgi:hypothetical protein